MNFLIVFLGAGIGGAARHGVNLLAATWSEAFPFGTMFINVLGSFLMGVIAEYFALRSHLPLEGRLFLTMGVLGGFTTFSAFSLEAVTLYERGELGYAALYVLGTVVLSVGGLFAGLAVMRFFLPAPQ